MTSTPGTTFQKRLVPAAVVVDSRNVRGQVADCFGYGRHVSVAGVIDMLKLYGFSVTEVFVGVATKGSATGSSYLQQSLAQNQQYAADIVSHPAGFVLEGRLVERSSGLEEKLVDVLCALQVARLAQQIKEGTRAGAIIVLSEDMDLIPAYEYAAEMGATVYAASNDVVDTRAQYSRWILLTEAALEVAAGRPFGSKVGCELRRTMAGILNAPTQRPLRLKTGGLAGAAAVHLQHSSGAKALWAKPPAGLNHSRGTIRSLHIQGIDWDDGPFPRFKVSDSAAAIPCPGLQVGTVLDCPSPTRATVQLPGGISKRLSDVTPGSLIAGMQVLVQVTTVKSGQSAWRLVGALTKAPPVPGWADPTTPLVVRATSAGGSAGARVRAKILQTGQEVTLQPPSEDRVQTGHEYAAVPVGLVSTASGVHVTAIAVSSRLR